MTDAASGVPVDHDAAMFRALFETAPDAMIVVDARGCIVLCNPQAERLFGYPAGELAQQTIEALVPAHVRGAHVRHRDGYMRDPRVRPMGKGQELSGRRRDGSEFPAEIGLSPIDGPGGRLYVASIRDIGETQRARQALQRARYDAAIAPLSRLALESDGYETVLASVPALLVRESAIVMAAILLAPSPGRPVQLRASVGVDESAQGVVALLGAAQNLPTVSRSGDAFLASRDSLGAQSASLRAALEAARLDDAAACPLFDRGQPMGVLIAGLRGLPAFDRDLTHFVRSVAGLLAASVQRARTEEQLAHAQRLEAVGQLTGGIAHDFNNLLTVISGNLQLLESELEPGAASTEIVAAALRATARGAELTRKLLVVARRQRLRPQAIDVHALLAELGPMLSRTLSETINVEIDCAGDVASLFVDPVELEAALLNLAINARDAMPRGGNLHIAARDRVVTPDLATEDLPAGHYVAIEVRDTGLGMTPEVLARAFEPFFTTKDTGRGSGLGLSMVYGFVKQSGGHVVVDSRLGYGTRIEISLPAAASPMRRAPAAPIGGAHAGSETILVVEDEDDVRRIAVAFLRSAGYVTLEASSAPAALALLADRSDIAMVFSDVVLGHGMNGAELAEAARRKRPGLAVLLTSGYENPGAQGDFEIAPDLTVLRKPYRREDLLAAIRDGLRSS